jgi:hypothetical protein
VRSSRLERRPPAGAADCLRQPLLLASASKLISCLLPACCLAAADCASEGEELLAPGSRGAYTFVAEEDGEYFFKCTLSDHCFEFGGNMNLQVNVSGC